MLDSRQILYADFFIRANESLPSNLTPSCTRWLAHMTPQPPDRSDNMPPSQLLITLRIMWMPAGCLPDASWMSLLGCLPDARWMPPRCSLDAPQMPTGCPLDASRQLFGSLADAPWMLIGCPLDAYRMPLGCFSDDQKMLIKGPRDSF